MKKIMTAIAVAFIAVNISAQAQDFPDHVGNKVKQLRIVKTDTSYEDGKQVISSDTSLYLYNAKGDKVKYKAGAYDLIYVYKYDVNNKVLSCATNFTNGENMDSCAYTYKPDGSGYYLSWNLAFVTRPDSMVFDSHGHVLQNFREGKLRWGTQFTYDKKGRLEKTTSGDKTIATCTYNEKGLMTTSNSLANATTTWYVYDAKGLLQSEYSRPTDPASKASRSSSKYYYTY